jgi:hypothetical protein
VPALGGGLEAILRVVATRMSCRRILSLISAGVDYVYSQSGMAVPGATPPEAAFLGGRICIFRINRLRFPRERPSSRDEKASEIVFFEVVGRLGGGNPF